jgi:hypothetical protein
MNAVVESRSSHITRPDGARIAHLSNIEQPETFTGAALSFLDRYRF